MAEEKKYGYHPKGCLYAGLEAMREKIAKDKLKNPFSTVPNPCGEQILTEGKLEVLTKGEDN